MTKNKSCNFGIDVVCLKFCFNFSYIQGLHGLYGDWEGSLCTNSEYRDWTGKGSPNWW